MSIPKTAKALVLKAVGGIEGFAIEQVPVVKPRVGSDEVLVKVKGSAIAYRDTLDRQGAFRFIQLPAVLGHEFSGTVVACGAASGFKEGDEVVSLHWNQKKAWPSPLSKVEQNSMFGLTCPGGYAQYATAPSGCFAPAPSKAATGIDLLSASSIMSTFGTVWQGAVKRGQLTASDSVLITGASGGVGGAAVKIAKAFGCRSIIGTTTSAAKVPFLKGMGCSSAIVATPTDNTCSEADTCTSKDSNNNKKSTSERTYSFKVPRGTIGGDEAAPAPTLIVEAVGGPTFTSSLRSLAPGGRIVLVGNVENSTCPLPLGLCILNSLSIIGSDSVERDLMAKELYPFMAENALRPEVAKVIPLEEVPATHLGLAQRSASGRFVVDMDL